MQMGWERVLLPSQNCRTVEDIPENGVWGQSPVAIIQLEAEPIRYAMRTDSLRLRLQPEEREQLLAFLRTLWGAGGGSLTHLSVKSRTRTYAPCQRRKCQQNDTGVGWPRWKTLSRKRPHATTANVIKLRIKLTSQPRGCRRSFVQSHSGINANVQTEPPVGILLAA